MRQTLTKPLINELLSYSLLIFPLPKKLQRKKRLYRGGKDGRIRARPEEQKVVGYDEGLETLRKQTDDHTEETKYWW
jgi:hypothetical protein